MTSTGTVTTAVEQAMFRRAEDGTIEVVASSLEGEQAERGWLDLVAPFLEPTEEPRTGFAFSYLTFHDGFAAVLRRTWPAHRPGTVDTHALLGLDAQLTPAVALSTSDWMGWLDEPGGRELPRLRASDLEVPDAAGRLRSWALSQADLLARTLAWLLQSPGTPLGVLGCPEEHRIPLLWGLQEIAQPELPSRLWTFSTNGDPGPGGQPAQITYFDMPPGYAVAPNRIVVDLHRDQGASPQNEYRANALVYRYEYGVDAPSVAAAPAVLPVPAPKPVPAAVDVTAPIPAVPMQTRPVWWAELVRGVITARDAQDLHGALVELELAVANLDDRDDVRAELENAGWGISAIHRHIPFQDREEAFDRIVRVAFGATAPDRATPAARADARRIASSSECEALVRALARASAREGNELAVVLARRWMLEHEPRVPDPTRGLGLLGRFLLHRGRAMTPARERRIVLLLAVFLSLVLGLVVGGVIW